MFPISKSALARVGTSLLQSSDPNGYLIEWCLLRPTGVLPTARDGVTHPGGHVGSLLGQGHCQAWQNPPPWLPDSPASSFRLASFWKGKPRTLRFHWPDILNKPYALGAGHFSQSSLRLWLQVLKKCPFHLPQRWRLCKWILFKVYWWGQKRCGISEVGAEAEWGGGKPWDSVQEARGGFVKWAGDVTIHLSCDNRAVFWVPMIRPFGYQRTPQGLGGWKKPMLLDDLTQGCFQKSW